MGLILRNSGGFVRLRGYNSQLSSQGFYLTGLPSFTIDKYSLAFNAEPAEVLGDYEEGILYFRDSSFNRVAATFSRTSDATRVNKQGLIETVATGIPRIDYTDGSAKLLMEPSRTNLIRYADFNAGVPTLWSVSFSQGTFTHTLTTRLDKPAILHEQTTSGRSPLNQNITFAPSTTYTFSMRVYDVNIISGSSALINIFDGVTGIVLNTTSVVNGFITHTFTTNASAAGGYIRIGIGAASTAQGSILFGTPQLEAGSYPTSYIPTAGSAVTRNAETLTATGLASHIGDAQGTLYLSSEYFADSLNSTIGISDGTLGNSVILRYNPGLGQMLGQIRNTSIVQTSMGYAISANVAYKSAIRYNTNDAKLFVDGTERASDTTVTTFADATLTDINNGFVDFYGLAQSIILFPTALTDSECEQITT